MTFEVPVVFQIVACKGTSYRVYATGFPGIFYLSQCLGNRGK